jgi:hypothetical protein
MTYNISLAQVTIVVVAVPEGLPLAVTLTYVRLDSGSQKLLFQVQDLSPVITYKLILPTFPCFETV